MRERVRDRRRPGWFWADNAIVDALPKIGPSAFAVYCVLARRANTDRRCWPSLNRLAQDAGFARNTVVNAIARLEELGMIGREQRSDDGLGQISTIYTLPSFETTSKSDAPCPKNAPAPVLNLGGAPVLQTHHEQEPVEQEPENKRERARGQQIPADFILTDDMIGWAHRELGMDDPTVRYWFEEFCDAVRSGGYKRHILDWPSTLRNSLRRNVGRPVPSATGGHTSPRMQRSMEAIARFARRGQEPEK